MSLCLEIVAVNGRPPDPPVRAAFGEAGGSLGRAEDNTLPLPDPDRHISRYHARVICRMGRHFILDGGSSTPVIHNGIVVGMGREAEIRPGDDIRIGQYLLRVAEAADGAALQPERDALSGGGLDAADLAAAARVGVDRDGEVIDVGDPAQIAVAGVTPALLSGLRIPAGHGGALAGYHVAAEHHRRQGPAARRRPALLQARRHRGGRGDARRGPGGGPVDRGARRTAPPDARDEHSHDGGDRRRGDEVTSGAAFRSDHVS